MGSFLPTFTTIKFHLVNGMEAEVNPAHGGTCPLNYYE